MVKEVTTLRHYLLGSISEEEIREIEISIASDRDLLKKLTIVENKLIEDFIEKTLSNEDVRLFHENFLITPKRKEQVIHISQLKQYAALHFVPKEIPESTETVSENERWFKLVKLNSLQSIIAILVLGLFIGGIGITFFYFGGESDPLEREYAQLNKRNFKDVKTSESVLHLNLKPISKRSLNTINNVSEDTLKDKDKVLFSLALPLVTNDDETFKVELITSQGIAFTQNQIRIFNNPSGQELRFFLPVKRIKKGNNRVRITSNTTDDFKITYSFLIE